MRMPGHLAHQRIALTNQESNDLILSQLIQLRECAYSFSTSYYQRYTHNFLNTGSKFPMNCNYFHSYIYSKETILKL